MMESTRSIDHDTFDFSHFQQREKYTLPLCRIILFLAIGMVLSQLEKRYNRGRSEIERWWMGIIRHRRLAHMGGMPRNEP